MNPIKSILWAVLILPPLLSQAVEKRTTIYTSDGYEKELTIDVPDRFASRADEYIKAYTILYMEWWNRGVGTTARNALKYHFDPDHFNENTPPRIILADVGRTVESHFSRNDLWEKVALEGANFIENINYKADNVETKSIELELKTYFGFSTINKIIPIPKKYSKRAEEYRNEYAIEYMKAWNPILREDRLEGLDTFKDSFSASSFYKFEREFTGIRIGGDVKNDIRKLFSSPEMREQIRRDQKELAERKAKKKKTD